MSDFDNQLSRRKMLARIGGLAAAAYAAPALTTMSMAHASSGASSGSSASSESSASSGSSVSSASEQSLGSAASLPSNESDCLAVEGVWEDGVCTLPEIE